MTSTAARSASLTTSRRESASANSKEIALYENVVRFCLKMESVVSQYEAEEFAKQMAQMFGRDRR
jgi:hypothetical protein